MRSHNHAEMLHRHMEINDAHLKSLFRQHFVILITDMVKVTWLISCNNETRLCIIFIACINFQMCSEGNFPVLNHKNGFSGLI